MSGDLFSIVRGRHGGRGGHSITARRAATWALAFALAVSATIVARPAMAADPAPQRPDGPYVDQTIAGDPDCDVTPTTFPGQRTLAGFTQTQTFTPSRGELRVVDLCLTASLELPVVITIFDEDDEPVATTSRSVTPTTAAWFSFELGAVTLTPGRTYRMDVTGPTGTGLPASVVGWRMTCDPGLLVGACSTAQDRYAGGRANPDGAGSGEFGPAADFGFRTSTAFSTDLTATIVAAPTHICPSAGRFSVDVAIDRPDEGTTTDTTVDVHLDGVAQQIGSATLKGSSAGPVTLTIALDVPSGADRRAALRAVVDGRDVVVETDETNNTSPAVGVKLTGCGEAGFDALSIEAANAVDGSGTVPAGVGAVPFATIADKVRFNGGVGASNAQHLANPDIWGHNPDIWGHNPDIWGHNPDIWGHNPYYRFNPDIWGHNPDIWGHNPDIWGHNPLRARPMLTAPVTFVPVPETAAFLDQVAGSSPGDVGNEASPFFGMPMQVFRDLPVNTIPLQRPREWDGYLQGTALEGEFIQNLALSDILALTPRPTPPLVHGELVADAGPLGRLNVGATSLGATRLADLPAPRGGWCALVEDLGAGCATDGDSIVVTVADGSTSRPTLVTLDALGFNFGRTLWGSPTSPKALFDLPLDAWLVDGALGIHPLSPLGYVPLLAPVDEASGTTFTPLVDPTGTGLAAIVVDEAMADVVDCDAPGIDCASGGTTLADVASADAWQPFTRFHHLLSALTAAQLSGLTASDLLLAVTNGDDFRDLPFEDADLDGLLLAGLVEPGDQVVRYLVTVDAATLPAALVDPTLTVSLPVGFAFIEGSASIASVSDPAAGVVAAASGGSGRSAQTLTLSTDLLLAPGARATLSFLANPGPVLGTFQTGLSASATHLASPAPVVVEVEPAAPIQVDERVEGVGIQPLPANTLMLSHLSFPGDVDTWSIPVPEVPLSELRLTLSHVPADYDLLVSTADTSSMFGNPDIWGHNPDIWGHNPDIWGHNPHATEEIVPEVVVADAPTGAAGSVPPQVLDDVPRDDEAFDQRGLRAVSIARGAGVPENLTIKVVEGETGSFNVQVSGYNQASSNDYYALHYQVIGPKEIDLGACQPLPWTRTTGSEGTLPVIDASNDDTNTLFLVPLQRVTDREGVPARAQLVATLEALGQRADLGVRGLVVPVEADLDVRAAYAAWDTSGRCDPSVANRVAASIRDVVMDYAVQLPGLEHVVVIGDDNAIPYMRYRDGNVLGNESSFLSSVVMEFGQPGDQAFGTPLTHALRSGMFLFDDHLGTRQMRPWLDQGVFIPSIAVGRISGRVETIVTAAQHFEESDGLLATGSLDLRAGVGTGYAHNLDGGQETAENLDASLAIVTSKLMGEHWDLADLQTAMDAAVAQGPSAISLNGHADHHHFLTADGNTRRDLSDSLDAKPTGPDDEGDLAILPPGSLLMSMGCHVNYDLPVDPTAIRDFADAVAARQGVIAANTGYNYGEATTVAAGELFNARFAARLGEGVTVGQAFALAKADAYVAEGNGAWEQLKSMQGMTLLGWPMYQIAHAAQQPPSDVPAPVRSTDAAGRQFVDITVDLTFQQLAVDRDGDGITEGSYFDVSAVDTSIPVTGVATDPLALDGRPLGPQAVLDVSDWLTAPGEEIRGVELIGLVSRNDEADFDPVFGDTVLGRADLEGDADNSGIFPLRPAVVRSTPTVGNAQVTGIALRPWTFRSVLGAQSGQVTGQLRLDEQMTLRVYFGALTERAHPTIQRVEVDRSSSTLAMDVSTRAAGTPVASVSALYRDAATGDWLREAGFSAVSSTGADTAWSAAGTFPTTTEPTEMLVSAVTETGIVSLWRNKGDLVNLIRPETLGFTLEGERGLNGWFTGPVTVELPPLSSGGIRYEYRDLDGEWMVTPRAREFDVVSDGAHSIDVREVLAAGTIGAQVTDVLIPIDQTGPAVQILSPAAGELPDLHAFTVRWVCSDAVSGLASADCAATITGPDRSQDVENGAEVRLPTGHYTLWVRGTDVAGNLGEQVITFSVPEPYLRFEGFFKPVEDGLWNEVTSHDDDGAHDPESSDPKYHGYVKLKWRVWDGNVISRDVSLVESITWVQVTCAATAAASQPVPGAQPETARSKDGAPIKSDDYYMQFKALAPTWVGPGCGRVDLALEDGQVFSAWFRRTK